MNNSVFREATITKRSFFQKLFKQHPQENAVIELNNLLVAKPLIAIQKEEVEAIERKYSLSLEKEFKLNLEEFYAVYLAYCLNDKVLTSTEVNDLQHLKYILNLDDRSIEHLHQKIGEKVYRQSFEEAVSDGRLTEHEEAFLQKLEAELKLLKSIADKISFETRTNFIQNYVADVIADERLSPGEEKEMDAIARSLNVKIELNEESKIQLQKLKLYWALENRELPTIQSDIKLQRGELCYLCIKNVSRHELRSVRQRVNYSGYSTNFRVAKGFYLRSGWYTPSTYSSDEMKLIDEGDLYLTNKRLLFDGRKKNSIIRLDKILSITPYSDGLEISKETGKSPLLILPEKADIFSIVLERLLREKTF